MLAQGTGVLDALACGVQQLQELQAQALQKGESSPEAIRQTIPPFPMLKGPSGDQSGLQLQDWLDLLASNAADVSENSSSWWDQVRDFVQGVYATWLRSTLLERDQLRLDGGEHLAEGKWGRLNARICTLLLASLEESIKQDLIARQATRSATAILMRLFVLYQPGGAAERTAVLSRLQSPPEGGNFSQALESIRAWPRWLRRCQEMKMIVFDGTVLARALTTVVEPHVKLDQDVMFRMQLVRSSLRVNGQPTLDQVRKYQEHLQSEMEYLATSNIARTTSSSLQVRLVSGPANRDNVEATTTEANKGDFRFFLKASGCRQGAKCPFRHDMGSLSKQQRARKCGHWKHDGDYDGKACEYAGADVAGGSTGATSGGTSGRQFVYGIAQSAPGDGDCQDVVRRRDG